MKPADSRRAAVTQSPTFVAIDFLTSPLIAPVEMRLHLARSVLAPPPPDRQPMSGDLQDAVSKTAKALPERFGVGLD
jgi:hypothetical protein